MTNSNDDIQTSISAYLRHLHRRIEFLDTLHTKHHQDEALLLCCCYIDGLAPILSPQHMQGGHKRFVRVVCEYGGDQFLPLIHPRQMSIALNRLKRDRPKFELIHTSIEQLLQGTALVTEQEFLTAAKSLLEDASYNRLAAEAWRGTMASLAYKHLRSPLVHQFRGGGAISFDHTTYQGRPVPLIDYKTLREVLARVFAKATATALAEGRFP